MTEVAVAIEDHDLWGRRSDMPCFCRPVDELSTYAESFAPTDFMLKADGTIVRIEFRG